jgi:kynurenine formamidase
MCSPEVLAAVRRHLQTHGPVNRRQILGASVVVAASATMVSNRALGQGATPVGSPAMPFGSQGVIDLTHTMTPETPVWPGNEPFHAETVRSYAEHGFYAQGLAFWEHTGTHIDAPAHFVEGAETAELLPVENFVAPLVVIDISDRVAGDEDTSLTVEDIAAWEEANGSVPEGAFVAMHSGWAAKIDEPEAFVNQDTEGVMHYPGFHPDATAMLIEERGIVGIGVDTLSLDPGNSTDFGSHIAVLGSGNYGIEGLANLDQAPAAGATIVVGAFKHLNGSGGPARVFALV